MRTRNKIEVQVVVYKQSSPGGILDIDTGKKLVVRNRNLSDCITLTTPSGEEVIVSANEIEDAVKRCQ